MASRILSRDFPKGTMQTLLFLLEQKDGFKLKDASRSVLRSAFNHLYEAGAERGYPPEDGEAMGTMLACASGD
jgi:hypothetical protein